MPIATPAPGPALTFTTSDHANAARVEAVLVALGFDVTRVVPEAEYDERAVTDRALVRLKLTHRLTPNELAVVRGILRGDKNTKLAETQGGGRNLKWVAHSLFTKLGLEAWDRDGVKRCVESRKDHKGAGGSDSA